MRNGGKASIGVLLFLLLCFVPKGAVAAYPELTLRHRHHLYSINPNAHPSWKTATEVWMLHGKEIRPPAHLRIDGDSLPDLPDGITKEVAYTWNFPAIEATLEYQIARPLNQEPGKVVIARSGEDITFDGIGYLGTRVNVSALARLVVDALEKDVRDIHIPVEQIQPTITVRDKELKRLGIKEVVGMGESNFSGSPLARRHNIANGLSKFNAQLILQDETFSFNDILGPVNEYTGYKKELVIVGPKTIPEYGGGLCQVSTTAYRGVWEFGFPITERRNHSFAVRYYSPQGTDATIYPPHSDIKFLNDGPSALLVQTHVVGDEAFFIYYGTKDGREAEVIGPFTWDHKDPPPDKTEYTSELPPGEEKVVGKAVSGMQSVWFRSVTKPGEEEVLERYYSFYEARPNYTQIGAGAPSWIGETDQPEVQEEKPRPKPTVRPRSRRTPGTWRTDFVRPDRSRRRWR